MTANRLQLNIVLSLSNQLWVRYWSHWNYPNNPTKMAIQCLESREDSKTGTHVWKPVRVKDLEREQYDCELFSDGNPDCQWIYVFDRTNEDGTPYVSKL